MNIKNLFQLSKLVVICWVAIFATSCTKQEITVSTLLDELISYDQPTLYPDPYYTCKQVSSYDRRSLSPGQSGWFANNDGFGSVSTDTIGDNIQMVMFDEEGPGAITRIWITTSNKEGRFKFYFDHSTEPNWVIEGYDLSKTGLPMLDGLAFRHTHYKEEVERTGGNTLFLPIPYARHCKIVLEYPVHIGKTSHYYHINYRTYQQDIRVKTFDFEEAKALAPKLEAVSKTLQQPPAPEGEALENTAQLKPGENLLLDCPEGSRAVRQLSFRIEAGDSSRYAEVMKKIVVKAQFDGKETIWVPLSDFSGGGFGAPSVKSWYLDANGTGNVTVRWTMPYQKNARIELVNYSNDEVKATIQAVIGKYQWDSKRSLYFHASWRQENGIGLCQNPDEGCIDWRFAEIQGRGVYAGDLLALFNHSPAWYGEGDEKIWVDDDTFPSHFGTGTEDYYNCSWAPVIPFHTPFGGAPRADLASSHGYNAFMRTRNLDMIPFREKFVFDLEMISWQPGVVDYATTIFWYGDLDAKAIGCSGVEEVKRDLMPVPPNPADYKIENSVEFEESVIIEKSASIQTRTQSTYAFDGKWSRAAQLLASGGQPGDSITFCFENLENRPYQLVVYATGSLNYGTIGFIVDGKKAAEFDGYRPKVEHAGPISLGTFTPQNGSITLQIKIIGTNNKSEGEQYMFGLDCITLK